MKIKTFKTLDYVRGTGRTLTEINFIGKRLQLRILLPRFSFSVWRNSDYRQIARFAYPAQ